MGHNHAVIVAHKPILIKMKQVKIFLDDVREPKDCLGYMYHRIGALNPIYLEEWVIVRNFDEFCSAVIKYGPLITHISLDHDLADEHYHDKMHDSIEEYYKAIEGTGETGYDCAKWLKKYLDNNGWKPAIFVHSMNPAGTQSILSVFQ